MKITILTLFPEMFTGPLSLSILKHAQEKKLVQLTIRDIREFGMGKHKQVDDTPYGGGIGMVMRVDVLHAALESVRENLLAEEQKVILMSAKGATFTQSKAKSFTTLKHLIIICGHYEGVDERVTAFIDAEISVGDFVVTGGEIPAMLITDCVTRLLPGVLKTGVTDHESFSLGEERYLEYPQFTNPRSYRGADVPEILLSGDHKKIATWRLSQAKEKTTRERPDLLKRTKEEQGN